MVIAILIVPCLPTYDCLILGITTIHYPSLFNWYVITDMHNHTPKVCCDWHSSGRWCYRCVVVVVITTAIQDQHLPFCIHVTEALLLEAAILATLRFEPFLWRLYQSHFYQRSQSHNPTCCSSDDTSPLPNDSPTPHQIIPHFTLTLVVVVVVVVAVLLVEQAWLFHHWLIQNCDGEFLLYLLLHL
jgi:membrane protein YdbS with pleckstrin-like domain